MTMNKSILLEAIQRVATSRPPETHHIKTLGVDVTFKRMSAFESDSLQMALINDKGGVEPTKMVGNRARTIAACIVDDEGNTFLNANDVQQWHNDIVDEMYKICRNMNKVGEADVADEVKG